GLRVLMVEQNDFASGTSSRSSKLVHGGLRYLNNFQFRMTYRSVCERDTLLAQGAGLIEPLPFLYPTYEDDTYPSWMMEIGLRVLMVEQNDFASGTSSRSSKLVHGGLRYLNNFQFRMTYRSVCERDTLLAQGAGLIEPLPFLYPTYEDDTYPSWMMEIGLRM